MVKDMSKSFMHVCELLGVRGEHCVDPNDSRVTQHRVSGQNRVRTVDLFDDELRGRVAEIWAQDIERFGFEFGELCPLAAWLIFFASRITPLFGRGVRAG